MERAHFIEVMKKDGSVALVRASAVEIIDPQDGGVRLCTAHGEVFAVGATRETICEDMRGANNTIVALNRSTPQKPQPKAELVETAAPARSPVVRAPAPIAVPELDAQNLANAEAAAAVEIEAPAEPPRSKSKKAPAA